MPRPRPRRPTRFHRPAAPSPPHATDVLAVAEAIAARQHGLVTRRQLIDAGVSPQVIERRVQAGRLVRAFRGVYRVGPLRSPRTREMAALLAFGPEAVISHESAAGVLALAGLRPPNRIVHVALRRGHRRTRPGVRLHRLLGLVDTDVATVDGLAVTTAARMLLDLAPRWRPRRLERALADAIERHLTTLDTMHATLERHLGRPGTRRLGLLIQGDGPSLTRSELEADFLELLRRGKVDEPRTNIRIGGFELDCYWPEARLAVELDGFSYHATRAAFERDRTRDAELVARGIRVIRVTYQELTRHPEAVLVRVGGALAAGR
jgi:very-short-patch-repair endonuclease